MASQTTMRDTSIRPHLPILLVALGAAALLLVLAAPADAEVVDIPVPYHRQVESWYCAEASLEMVFDYWGEDISQHDIGDVANERQVGGTYASDLARAARFSNFSTAVQARELGGARLQGYDQRTYGYAAHVHQWKGSGQVEYRYIDLMDLVRQGYPVILLCWLDIEHEITHFRVVKGFDTDTGDFLVHDPALGSNLRFNMTLLVDDLWTYYDRWGMVVVPWSVEVSAPSMVGPGDGFAVQATVTYPCPQPFDGSEKVYTWPQDPTVTILVPPPFSLATGENATVPLNITRGGDSDTVVWNLVAPVEPGYWTADLVVRAEALVTDTAISYGWYEDTAGGVGLTMVGCDALPPTIRTFIVADGETLVPHPIVTMVYDAFDDHSGVSQVSLSIDGGVIWRPLEGPSGGLDVHLDAGDGPYEARLRVVDAVGNSVTEVRSLVLDSTPPRVRSLRMAGGSDIVTTARVLVEIDAVDDTTSIEGLSVKVGNGPWSAWGEMESELWVDLPTDGTHVVEVRLRDEAGNVATASDQVTLDTTVPYIQWFEVAEGLSFSRTASVPVSLSAGDDLGGMLEWSIHEDGSGGVEFLPGRVMSSGEVLTMEWTLLGEGPRTLVLTVRDEAGHTADASVSLVVDTRPPRVVMVLNGGRGVTTTSDIPVAVTVSDETTEVVKARIRVNSNEWGPWSDPGAFRRVDLGPEDGLRTVHVQAQDQAGNLAEASASVMLDSTAPTVTVSFTRTRPGGVVLGDSELVLTFSEAMDASSVEVLLMDNSSGMLDCDLEWSGNGTVLTVDPVGDLPRGSHFVFTVSGGDLVGNQLDFRGVLFSTPEAERDDWETVLPGGSSLVLLLVVLLLVAAIIGGYAVRSRKER